MSKTPIEVYYWKVRGIGTRVNHFLAALDLPFNVNNPTGFEDWGKQKAELMKNGFHLANLPMIKDPNNGNVHKAETHAILMYLAQKYKPETGPTMEELPDFMAHEGVLKDIYIRVAPSVYTSKTKEEIKTKIDAVKPRMLSKFGFLEKTLSSNDWLFANRFTYLDVVLANLTELIFAMEKELNIDFYNEATRVVLSKHMDRVYSMEGVKKWRSSEKFSLRPFFPLSFCPWG